MTAFDVVHELVFALMPEYYLGLQDLVVLAGLAGWLVFELRTWKRFK